MYVFVYPIGEFKECTILFSDVVTFTDICSLCEPIQIVLMLNSMYLRFDRLTTVHNVYKVHTADLTFLIQILKEQSFVRLFLPQQWRDEIEWKDFKSHLIFVIILFESFHLTECYNVSVFIWCFPG